MTLNHKWSTVAVFLAFMTMAAAQEPASPSQVELQPPSPQLDRPLSGAQMQRLPAEESSTRGILDWGLTASDLTVFTDNDNYSRLGLYTDLGYNQLSGQNALELRYNGGVLMDTGRDSSRNDHFHNFALSEGWSLSRWNLTLGDTVAYQSESQGTGGSIPGLGQYLSALPFTDINPNLLLGNSILTFNTPQLTNSAFGQAQYNLTRATSATFVASYGLLRYLDYSRLDNHQYVFTAGLDHEMRHARFATRYTYTRYGYETTPNTTEGHSAELMFSRALGRSFQTELSFGPQLIQSHGASGNSRFIPSGYFSLNYGQRRNSFLLRYQRGLNAGSGFLQGAIGDTVQGTLGRQYRSWGVSLSGSYMRTEGLYGAGNVNTRSAEARLSRNLGRNFSAYVSYGFQSQSSALAPLEGLAAFNGKQHMVGAGLTWHPEGVQVR